MVVPEVLRKFIPGAPEFLPWVREMPKETMAQKKQKSGGAKPAATTVEKKESEAPGPIATVVEKVKELTVGQEK